MSDVWDRLESRPGDYLGPATDILLCDIVASDSRPGRTARKGNSARPSRDGRHSAFANQDARLATLRDGRSPRHSRSARAIMAAVEAVLAQNTFEDLQARGEHAEVTISPANIRASSLVRLGASKSDLQSSKITAEEAQRHPLAANTIPQGQCRSKFYFEGGLVTFSVCSS
jgi:hypothetical protein